MIRLLCLGVCLAVAPTVFADKPSVEIEDSSESKLDFLECDQVVFLGDSNLHAGEWLVQFEAAVLDQYGKSPEMVNLGLASETCSGLSEPTHPFPRPCVLERIDRVLAKTQPEIVVACYGVNDAIYHPFSEDRFAAFQSGIETLIAKVKASGANLVLITPPPFDPLPYQKSGHLAGRDAKVFSWETIYENYDSEVMARYAQYIRSLQADVNLDVDLIVDVYSPLSEKLTQLRESDPDAMLTTDGIHLTKDGHAMFAKAVLSGLGLKDQLSTNDELTNLVRKRQGVMHLAWLEHVGHQRPGVAKGLPMDKAKAQIDALDHGIRKMINHK
ncbi:GDSL-type esterase/lipase family protein [Rubripirellula amarantea]|nr:GDSL-type esterase/lipase family protein [Rubripirellula amarantea]